MRERLVRHLVVVAAAVLVAGCAPKVTARQALVEEAFKACQPQGPSTRLEKVQPDGRFSVVGREADAQRVHDCMVRFHRSDRLGAGPSVRSPYLGWHPIHILWPNAHEGRNLGIWLFALSSNFRDFDQ